MHKITRVLTLFLVFVLAPVATWGQTIPTITPLYPHIEEFHVEMTVNPDSSIDVTESILYNFLDVETHGIVRQIPMTYNSGSEEIILPFTVKSVTDENGTAYTVEDRSSLGIDVKIGDADKTITGKHWYIISYHVDVVINGFETHDELYWNVTGNEWPDPILHATATVKVPAGGAAAEHNAVCYTGTFGSTEQLCTATVDDERTFTFATTEQLWSGEGLTIAAGFEKGVVELPAQITVTSEPTDANVTLGTLTRSTPYTFRIPAGTYTVAVKKLKYVSQSRSITMTAGSVDTEPFTLEKAWWAPIVETYLPLTLLVLFPGLLLFRWWTTGRDPKGRGTIIPQYEPPKNMTPGEMGVVIDDEAHMHDISAGIIHLATLGFLKIRKDVKKSILKDKIDYTFIKTGDPATSTDVPEYEKLIFTGLFEQKEEVALSALKQHYYVHLDKIKKALYQAVVDNGYYARSPHKVSVLYLGLALTFFIIGGGLLNAAASFFESGWYIIAWIVTSIVFFIIAKKMPRRTKLGAETREYIFGFKKFLTLTEKDRLKFFNSPKAYADTFEKYLPYAMVLGVEEEWAKEFQDVYKTPPTWYEGNDAFNVLLFAQSMRLLNRTAQTTMRSNPNSGGSFGGGSGFSGGFSGGGFGGGGGGSW